ncbi:DUF418 domain-containing protein [Neobacillus sp. D3-1R]|uniref:DUF418 domain-containing protein n=1 Tax=Neobacillus sp. D3-1R TaxID=3445778 RepID=UPI003FA051A2
MKIQDFERIKSIDAIRGFAILGIFLTNMLDFHSPMLYINPYEWWPSKSQHILYSLIDFFVQASFYPIFACLFGFSLVVIRERAMVKGLSFISIAVRRLLLLLVIGCIHAYFIWHGDILMNYAVFGFGALLFLHLSGKRLIYIGILSYMIPNILFSLLLLVVSLFSPVENFFNKEEALRLVDVYQNGSFFAITKQRFHDWYLVNGLDNILILFFSIFPFILIGAGIAKLNLIRNNIINQKKLTQLLLIFGSVGCVLKLLPFVFRNLFTEYIQDIFGGPLLGFTYAILIILLMDKFLPLKIFQSVGKMAISHYLFQSLVATLLFYSYGFGFYNKISIGTGTLIAVTIYLIQALISTVWLRSHHYGPVEWIWRAFSYCKKPTWRKGRSSS